MEGWNVLLYSELQCTRTKSHEVLRACGMHEPSNCCGVD